MFFGPICIPFKYARLIMRLSLGATERLLHCDLEKQSFCFVWGVKAAYICPLILGESLVHWTALYVYLFENVKCTTNNMLEKQLKEREL